MLRKEKESHERDRKQVERFCADQGVTLSKGYVMDLITLVCKRNREISEMRVRALFSFCLKSALTIYLGYRSTNSPPFQTISKAFPVPRQLTMSLTDCSTRNARRSKSSR